MLISPTRHLHIVGYRLVVVAAFDSIAAEPIRIEPNRRAGAQVIELFEMLLTTRLEAVMEQLTITTHVSWRVGIEARHALASQIWVIPRGCVEGTGAPNGG